MRRQLCVEAHHAVVLDGPHLYVLSAYGGVMQVAGKSWAGAQVLWAGPEFVGPVADDLRERMSMHNRHESRKGEEDG